MQSINKEAQVFLVPLSENLSSPYDSPLLQGKETIWILGNENKFYTQMYVCIEHKSIMQVTMKYKINHWISYNM